MKPEILKLLESAFQIAYHTPETKTPCSWKIEKQIENHLIFLSDSNHGLLAFIEKGQVTNMRSNIIKSKNGEFIGLPKCYGYEKPTLFKKITEC